MGGSTFIQVWIVLPEYYEQFSMWGVPNICTARTLWICFKQDLISILSLNLIKFEETSIEKLSTHTVNHTTITVIITRTLSYLVLLFWLAGWLASWLAAGWRPSGWQLAGWWLAGWLAGCCWLTEVSWLTVTCFEAALFRCGVCWQLRIFLALPYIYSLDRPIRSQHFQCPGWPIRSQDCEWQNSGFWLVSLCIKVWATLGQCPSLCSTLKGRTSISNNLEWIRAIWWQFQEAPWVGKAGNSNF